MFYAPAHLVHMSLSVSGSPFNLHFNSQNMFSFAAADTRRRLLMTPAQPPSVLQPLMIKTGHAKLIELNSLNILSQAVARILLIT